MFVAFLCLGKHHHLNDEMTASLLFTALPALRSSDLDLDVD